MKRKGFGPQLSPQQQLILTIVLIVLVAVSLLYCLGFASLLLRSAWENAPLPWNGASPTAEIMDLTPLPEIEPIVTEVVPHQASIIHTGTPCNHGATSTEPERIGQMHLTGP